MPVAELESLTWGLWLFCLLLGAGFYFLGLPLLIWATLKNQAEPTLQTIDVATCPLPPAVQEYLDEVEPGLLLAGLDPVETIFSPGALHNVKTFIRLYANRPQKDVAIATCAFATSTGSNQTQNMNYVEFCTRYSDGREINTGNAVAAGVFPKRRLVSTMHFPWITCASRLYEIHQAVLATKISSAEKVLRLDRDFDGDASRYLADCMQKELASAADAGYIKLAPSGVEYHATLKGAYLMTWWQLPPFKQLVRMLRRKKAERVLRSVGMA